MEKLWSTRATRLLHWDCLTSTHMHSPTQQHTQISSFKQQHSSTKSNKQEARGKINKYFLSWLNSSFLGFCSKPVQTESALCDVWQNRSPTEAATQIQTSGNMYTLHTPKPHRVKSVNPANRHKGIQGVDRFALCLLVSLQSLYRYKSPWLCLFDLQQGHSKLFRE